MKIILMLRATAVLVLIVFQLSCTGQQGASATKDQQFNDYWYQGKAELTSYDLQQARYGEIHPGHAVLIFVTEDFSRSKQVKLDNPGGADPDDRVKVMKLNFTKKFLTGIYPYSMMSSIFTPVGATGLGQTLKITASSQEWCGHTFTQLNHTRDGYNFARYSYFESEGDQEGKLRNAILEDEVWNVIRTNPGALPVGDLEIVPSLEFLRLGHRPLRAYQVRADLTSSDGGLQVYTLQYPQLNRTLTISFEKDFPYRIQGWEESRSSGFGRDARTLTTTATLRERTVTDYWTQNGAADRSLRSTLGLDEQSN